MLIIYELVFKTSQKASHGAFKTFSSFALSEHNQQAQNQDYRWLTPLFSNFMSFVGLQTTTIIKSEYSTILSPLLSGFSSSVSLHPCLCLMKCNKTL